MTQAVILAAGLGSRLRPLTDDRPKALVRVGAEPILGRALDALTEAGIKSAVIVTGYRQDAVLDYLSSRLDVRWTTVENAAYAQTNTLASLMLAAPLVDDDFFLIDGDLVFEPAVIARLDGPGVRLAIDTSRPLDDEAVKVALVGERVVAVGKKLPPGTRAEGESIGIAHVDTATAGRLVAVGRRLLAAGAAQAYYEAAFQTLVDEGHLLEAADVAGLRWVEVDDHDDLQRAESLFAAGC
jgi:choline kinase